MTQKLLSPNFSLAELTVSATAKIHDIPNSPGTVELTNLRYLALKLEKVKEILGNKPVIITSAFRSQELNRVIGGAKNSQHMTGLAADLVCPEYGGPYDVFLKLAQYPVELDFDQLIFEHVGKSKWVHIGFIRPRKQTLIIDRLGTRVFES